MSDVAIYIDGRRFQAQEGKNLLEVALSLGFDVPYFCWHPAMGSVGACRQCAVRLYSGDDDETGEIAMSCMTPVRDRLRVSVADEEAVSFRRSVIELLMASHPHDCPVCDEGGECHLQDMTVLTGHVYRRYRGRKRTYRNQNLGSFVTHEMNRCIQCYRCVRFYVDYAGEHDLAAFGLRNNVYFGRCEDGTLRSEFSGNLIEVCPVGVFNDKTLAQTYTRKWDLQTSPSICPHCGYGCNIFIGERYGELRRVLNRYNDEVNGYFICDRGRFGYQAVNGSERLRRAYCRDAGPESDADTSGGGGPSVAAELAGIQRHDATAALGERNRAANGPAAGSSAWHEVPTRLRVAPAEELAAGPGAPSLSGVAEAIVDRLAGLLEKGAGIIGIGSPRASLEANFALRRLVGAERFHAGIADGERELVDLSVRLRREGGVPAPSKRDLQRADLVIVLGEDITNVAPMLALNVRLWARLRPTAREDELHILRWNDAGVGDVKRYQSSALWSATPAPSRLDRIAAGPLHAAPQDIARAALAVAHAYDRTLPLVDTLDEGQSAWAETLIYALMEAERPLVISGTTCGSAEVLRAAALLARALPGCLGLGLLVPEANTMGLALMGGRRLSEAFSAAAKGAVEAAVVVENDLYRRAAAVEVAQFLDDCPFVVAVDHTLTPTVAHAAALLPAATWAESTGTLVSHDGRAQRYAGCLPPREQARESWRWLALCMEWAGRPSGWDSLDDVLQAMADELPQLAGARDAMPGSTFRTRGMKVARLSRRSSGRTAVHAPLRMVEPAPPADPDSPLAYSMEGLDTVGAVSEPPASLTPRYWAPGWSSAQALNKFQEEVGGPLRADHSGVLLLGSAATSADSRGADSTARAGAPSVEDALSLPGVPPAFVPSSGRWLVVPLHHIFGSEELSALAPAVAERVPPPYLALSDDDARSLFGCDDDGLALLEWGGYRARLPVRRLSGLPGGIAGVPVGLPGMGGPQPPFLARITPEVRTEEIGHA